MPNLKVLSKIFSKLLHAETNLSGGNGSMIGLYESYACFHHYNIQRSNYNHLPEIDTAHLTLVIDNPPTHLERPVKNSFMSLKCH